MKTASYATLFTCLTSLSAIAHPGPAGHTHDDDWPFDPLPMAIAIAVALIASLAVIGYLQRRSPSPYSPALK